MAKILSFLILAYQKVSWLLFPRCCRFHPSCSSYALEAIEKHGACKGLIKTLLRIFRCSPLSRGGYDPVR